MSKRCLVKPEQNCFGLKKAEEIEDEFNNFRRQNSDSHERAFNQINELERVVTNRITDIEKKEIAQDKQFENFLEKVKNASATLDVLSARITALELKPARKWDDSTKQIVTIIIAAVMSFVLGRLGFK